MGRYLILVDSLPDHKYMGTGKLSWHERVRIKLVVWLFNSVPKPVHREIETTTGSSSKWL